MGSQGPGAQIGLSFQCMHRPGNLKATVARTGALCVCEQVVTPVSRNRSPRTGVDM